jgi:signal transduction histidine kinase/ligand-binding sensor domain-containing protein
LFHSIVVMMHRWAVLCLIGILFAQLCTAQEYRFRPYRVEQGLPSDVIKAVTEDSLGFFWIATDDGLVKYDGIRFTTYKSAFHSQYTKGFLHTRDGRFFAFGDLDFIEIQNRIDTVIFKTVLQGTRTPTDSTIWYPKSAYEDHSGNIWLAEPQSLIKYDGQMKRYDLGPQHRSPVFLRSFFFVEDDQGILYAIGNLGEMFRYLPEKDQFEQLNSSLPNSINDAKFINGAIWMAAANGFYRMTVEDGESKILQNILPIENASHVLLAPDSTWWISTYGDDVYRFQEHSMNLDALLHNFQGVNSSYLSREGDLWVATDKGLILVQKNQFITADPNSKTHFVEDMAYDKENDLLFYCSKEMLIELHSTANEIWEGRTIFSNPKSYFQSLQFGMRGLWASSMFDVMLFEKGVLKRQWNFASEGNFVHDILLDTHQNLWLSQSGATSIKVIHHETLEIERIPVPVSAQSEINLVREGSLGMYAGASGLEGYVFFKPHGDASFHNISQPVKFNAEGDFNVHDIAVQDSILWLATTEGLLKHNHRSVERINLGEFFTNFPVSSVEVYDDRNILFSNSYGLFRYDVQNGNFWLYDENAGLPSNTITDHGILIDARKRVWIGTSFGLALAVQPVISPTPTPKPICIDASVNGTSRPYVNGLDAPYGAFINVQFSSITFPENKINLQWRWTTETDWHVMKNHEISLTDLNPGTHILEVRAKKNTGQDWSESTALEIHVERPYWQKAEFVFLVLFVCILIAWISYTATARLMQKRKEYLQNLVQERTQDLQKANEELMIRNTELDRFVYSASHDLSAPLKSILGLITVARLENPDEVHLQYLLMMERSVRKLEEFIKDVVSFSRTTRMPVRFSTCYFTEIVEGLLHDHQYSPNFDKINFIISDGTGQPMTTDVTRIKIILNNLISNAIKFQRYHGPVKPFVKISLARNHSHYILSVQDNGTGIEEKHLKHIFEMFYRASEQSQGSGLGLYILNESVAKLNGTVEAHSILGDGTTFIISLPIPTPEK